MGGRPKSRLYSRLNARRRYSPLGRGYLTGKIDANQTFTSNAIRSRNPHFTAEASKANQGVVDLLSRIGQEKQATPAQIALAWLLA